MTCLTNLDNSGKSESAAPFDVEDVLSKLTLTEKCLLLGGKDNWHLWGYKDKNVPSIRTSDGPNGIRGTRFFAAVPAACFPCGTALGSTWDQKLLEEAGKVMGEEARAKGVHVILGPTVNIQRSPLGGRGFESFSEDPYLSGLSAAAVIKGIQSKGIQACIKHFVCNDQEDGRKSVNALMTDRALREIYLVPFMLAVRDAKPGSFMTAYNKVNGTHVSQNEYILKDILRSEWGWKGLIMSDWTGVYAIKESIHAGLDLEMPGPTLWRGKPLQANVTSKEIPLRAVDERARSVLEFIKKCAVESGIPENAPEKGLDTPETAALLRKIAADSTVLLKNESNILPLSKEKTTAVIGPNGKVTTYCGGGSASLTPYYTVSPYEGISSKLKTTPKYALGVSTFASLPLLDDMVVNDKGERGYKLDVYTGPKGDTSRKHVDSLYQRSSYMLLNDFVPKGLSKGEFYFIDFEGFITPQESGTYEFGVTVSGAAQLFVDDKLVVDNGEHQTPGDSFFGVGTVEEVGQIELEAGKKYKLNVYYDRRPRITKPGVVDFSGGLRIGGMLKTADELSKAVEAAKSVDQVILTLGLNSDWESEGYDRTSMDLPPKVDELVEAVIKANPNTVAVIQSGTPVTLPWHDKVKGILQAWYGGNETGNGIADVLFGDVNPSGKLSLSYPKKLEDNPAYLHFNDENGSVLYNDDVYVGYRHYEIHGKDTLFPFGHGLSYTTFDFTNAKATVDEVNVVITVDVTNKGKKDGASVVQVYVSQKSPSIRRPVKELKGYTKVFVKAGTTEEATVTIPVKYATSFWNEAEKYWVSEADTYTLHIGHSSADINVSTTFDIAKTTTWNGV